MDYRRQTLLLPTAVGDRLLLPAAVGEMDSATAYSCRRTLLLPTAVGDRLLLPTAVGDGLCYCLKL